VATVAFEFARRGFRTGAKIIAYLAHFFAIAASTTIPAGAIPSPELVVGSLSSLSQLFTLLTAVLGGGALFAGARAARAGATAGRPRIATSVIIGAIVFLGASLLGNWYQYSQTRQDKQARLEATLLRPARTPGMPQLDPTLKELSFPQQLKHPLGVSTDETAEIVVAHERGELKDTVIIDVRESAESMMGNLPGAIVARYPDFDDLKLDLAGKKALLFCHNGNRSHETCEILASRGIDCSFVVGGLEKWVTENRPMTGLAVRTLDTLRAIPPYPAQRVLLDNARVHELVGREGAVFVDVRYAPEFKAGHLPNAINLPIRRLTKLELRAQIEALPDKPLILPCYDRRGCFFAEVLGYELDKAGRDLRGRFTVPWEYFPASARPPHVEQWLKDSQVGLWEKLVRAAAAALGWLTDVFGIVGAIIAAAVLSRLIVLPFSLKAERDQLVARNIEPEIAALKQRLKSDPLRLSRALKSLYRRHALTPARNLVALAFVPLLGLLSLAVQRVASSRPSDLLWIESLGERDPYLILPISAAALFGLYLHMMLARSRRNLAIVWLMVVPFLVLSLGMLGAAVNLYIVSSAILLIVQRTIAGASLEDWKSRLQRLSRTGRSIPRGIVPLAAVEALQGCGNKAYRLAQLKAAGVNVPGAVVLTDALLQQIEQDPRVAECRLAEAWSAVGSDKVAVRSSGAAEDGSVKSFAGVFESVLDVDRAGFAGAVARVAASFRADKVASYAAEAGAANILVQRMVAAQYAGVLFTRDPASAGLALVELVEGSGDGLVSGIRTPEAYRFGRSTGRSVDRADDAAKPPIDLAPLLELGRLAETLFAAPQDVEWAYADGKFHVLQSRDITAPIGRNADAVMYAEWSRIIDLVDGRPADDISLAQSEVTEVLPQPTALSLSLMQDFWSSGGSIDLASSRLGMGYSVEEDSRPYVVSVFGRLYVDRAEAGARKSSAGKTTLRRLRRNADRIEHEFRQTFLPTFLARIRLADAVDFDRLATTDLLAELQRCRTELIERTHVEVDVVNMLAQLFVDEARRELERLGVDAAKNLTPHHVDDLKSAVREANKLQGGARLAHLELALGHRADVDYELACPRYSEDRAGLTRSTMMISAVDQIGVVHEPEGWPHPVAVAVDRARRFQVLKEDAKHHMLRELALLRKIVLAVDRRFGLEGSIFHLTFSEIAGLDGPDRVRLVAEASTRRDRREVLVAQPAPSAHLTPAMIELASNGSGLKSPGSQFVSGTRVSGSSASIGRALVISTRKAELGEPIEDFRPGDIIVARMISPAWLPHLREAGGLVCELGGWLSHIALLARELDLPMIVGARGLDTISDKSMIELCLDGSVRPVENQMMLAAQ
jgi:rifampicin phosphotransferase